jgi:hypothetical protein
MPVSNWIPAICEEPEQRANGATERRTRLRIAPPSDKVARNGRIEAKHGDVPHLKPERFNRTGKAGCPSPPRNQE